MCRRILIIGTKPLLAVGVILLFAVAAVASPSQHLNFGTQLNAAECDTTGGKLVINVVQQVTGDIDSGQDGNYWAYDEYIRHIQVWQVSPAMFCAVVKYAGSFTTVEGTGPGPGGAVVGAGVTGTMEGGYMAVITGSLKSSPLWKTKGNVGSYNYSCVASSGACTGRVSWLDQYFDGWDFDYSWWGWVYHAGNNGSWVNSSDGNSGDITGNP